ncbi:MAG: isoprenyl transferase [Christensenellales bacterium]|jgi:undecaprenyl diphosphate synthase
MAWFGRKKSGAPEHTELDPQKIPAHIAMIMDGNGRWATRRGLPRTAGHRAGVEVLRKLIRYCGDLGVKVLTLYAFSTENWKRPKEEVGYLMQLLVDYFNSEIDELDRQGAVIRVMGQPVESDIVRETIENARRRTKDNTGIIVNIAFNYGGRSEIVRAAKAIAKAAQDGALDIGALDEERFSDYLYTAGLPDPDIIIRTSGESRISNFLLYQNAYSEWFFIDTLWPDMNEDALADILVQYQSRQRRFGGV